MQCPEQSWLTIVRQNKPIDIHCEILMLPDDVHGTRPEEVLSLYHDCEEIMKAIAFDKKSYRWARPGRQSFPVSPEIPIGLSLRHWSYFTEIAGKNELKYPRQHPQVAPQTQPSCGRHSSAIRQNDAFFYGV